jgi:O-antigen/teichoic acid export membrane protein
MYHSRTDNAKKNAISGVVNKVLLLLLGFVVRTLFIHKLGTEILGLNSFFTSLLMVLNMAELGFSSAVTFSLYKPLAEMDYTAVRAYLTYYKNVYKVIGIVVIVVGIVLLPFIPYLIKGSYPDNINVHTLFVMFFVNTSISYLFWGYKAVLLSALQKHRILSNIDTALSVIKSALQIVMILYFKNYYYYVACLLLATILNNVIVKYVSDRFYSEYAGTGNLDEKQKKAIVKKVGGLAIGKISATARNSFDNIVLAMFAGLIDVAIYSNYYYVINLVLGFITVFTQAMAAGIGNSVVAETAQKNYDDFKKFYFLFGWVGAFCTISILCLYQPFMELWVGKNLVLGENVMFLFVCYFYILQSGQLRSLYSRASGIWWELRYFAICEAILNLLLNFVLGYYFGMKGILIATIATVSVFGVVLVGKVTVNLCFKKSALEFLVLTGLYAVVTFILSSVMYLLVRTLNVHGYVGLILIAGLCLFVPNALILGLSMTNKKTRRYVYELSNKLFIKNGIAKE